MAAPDQSRRMVNDILVLLPLFVFMLIPLMIPLVAATAARVGAVLRPGKAEGRS